MLGGEAEGVVASSGLRCRVMKGKGLDYVTSQSLTSTTTRLVPCIDFVFLQAVTLVRMS